MLIIGAGGFAKQLIEIFDQKAMLDQITLFDDVLFPPVERLYGRIPILHTESEVKKKFKSDNRFVLGIGNPVNRSKLAERFIKLGGQMETIISPNAIVSAIACEIGRGVNILTGVIIENGVFIGEGSLLNIGSFITHDNKIGKFTEISPGVRVSGGCVIGDFCFIGTGSVIIPGIAIGNHVVVAAGTVITENIPDSVLVAGVPAKIKKRLNE
jgi:sugar O-acyltransferase (sialic acid O-acetyltransferase NeuD family)